MQEPLNPDEVLAMMDEHSGSDSDFDGEGVLGSETDDASVGSGAAVEDAAPTGTPCAEDPPALASADEEPAHEKSEFDATATSIVQGERRDLFKVVVDGVLVFEGKKMATRKFICEQAGCNAKHLVKLGITGVEMLNKLTLKPAAMKRAKSNAPTPAVDTDGGPIASPAKRTKKPEQKSATAPAPAAMIRASPNASPVKRPKKPVDMNVSTWPLDRVAAFAEAQAANAKPGPYLAQAASSLGVSPDSLVSVSKLIATFTTKRDEVNAAVTDVSTTGRQRCAALFGELAAIMGQLTAAGLDADVFDAQLDEGKIDIEKLLASFGQARTKEEEHALSEIKAILDKAIPMVKKALAA
jgi:hypothetical protein